MNLPSYDPPHIAAPDQIAGHGAHQPQRDRASAIVLVLIALIVAVIGFTSAEALARIAADQERSSSMQQLIFRFALGGLLGSALFFAALWLWMSHRRRR